MYFGAMGAGLKFHGFSGLPVVTPELRERTSGVVKCFFLGALEEHLLDNHGLKQQDFTL